MPANERPNTPSYGESYDPTTAAPTETPVPPTPDAEVPQGGPTDPWTSVRSYAEEAARRFQGLDSTTKMGLGAAALAALGGAAYLGNRAMTGGRAPARGPTRNPLLHAARAFFGGAPAARSFFGGAPAKKPFVKQVPKKPMGGTAPAKPSYFGGWGQQPAKPSYFGGWGKVPAKGKPGW